MSASWWFVRADPDTDDDVELHFGLTYNLNAMLWEAGWRWGDGGPPQTSFPNSAVWSKDDLEGVRAGDLGEKVAYVVANLRADPEKYRAMNPPNGWGDYEAALRVFEDFLAAIEQYPDAIIGCWF